MLESNDLDFSFSGLKTAVGVYLRACDSATLQARVPDICASFQAAVVDTLVAKTLRAVEAHRPASVILAGGVAANKSLREALARRLDGSTTRRFLVPDLKYAGDNAAMIAAAGCFRALAGDFVDPLALEANPNLRLG
jgi:N6-L-threonylcarbamoyladenine synthase